MSSHDRGSAWIRLHTEGNAGLGIGEQVRRRMRDSEVGVTACDDIFLVLCRSDNGAAGHFTYHRRDRRMPSRCQFSQPPAGQVDRDLEAQRASVDGGEPVRPGCLELERIPGDDEDPQRGGHLGPPSGQAGPGDAQLQQPLVGDWGHAQQSRGLAGQAVQQFVGHTIHGLDCNAIRHAAAARARAYRPDRPQRWLASREARVTHVRAQPCRS
jgi:hypothetical protein